MNRPSLAVYAFGFEIEKIKYPMVPCLRSALDLADRVFFCACDDETEYQVRQLMAHDPNGHRITLSRHPWAQAYFGDAAKIESEGYKIQPIIANFLLDQIDDRYDWALKLDADEVLDERSFGSFYEDLRAMQHQSYMLGRPHYTHICPDDQHQFPFIYRSKAVLSSTRSGFRFKVNHGGDACALDGAPEFQTRLEVVHYGKMAMGREREALYKERSFTALYHALGFPDPKVEAQAASGHLDYMKVFDEAAGRGEFSDFAGPHPKYVREWLATMRERAAAFAQELSNGH